MLPSAAGLVDSLAVTQEQEPEDDLGQEVQDQEQEYLKSLVNRSKTLGPDQEHDGVQAPLS